MPHTMNFKRVTPMQHEPKKPLSDKQKKALRHKRRGKAAALKLDIDRERTRRHAIQIARELWKHPSRKRRGEVDILVKQPAKVIGYQPVREKNKRYPLTEIRAAKAAGRKLKPKTKAAHW